MQEKNYCIALTAKETFELREVPVPEPLDDEVLLKP